MPNETLEMVAACNRRTWLLMLRQLLCRRPGQHCSRNARPRCARGGGRQIRPCYGLYRYQEVSLQLSVIALACVLALFFWNWWLMLLWLCMLAGVVGGKVFQFQVRWQRYFHLSVLLYLVALLLIWVFPQLLPAFSQTPELKQFTQYGLPLLFPVMLLLPVETDTGETPHVVDFFYSAFLFMIIVLLVLGSFAFMTLGRVNYPIALTYSLLLIAPRRSSELTLSLLTELTQ